MKPWYLKALAGSFIVLSILDLFQLTVFTRDPGLLAQPVLVRFILVAVALGVAGVLLLRGSPWGYMLGLLIAVYWLWVAERLFRWSPHGFLVWPGAVSYLVFGIVALAALLAPRSRHWFERSWRSRAETPA